MCIRDRAGTLKQMGIETVLVQEYAKELAYQGLLEDPDQDDIVTNQMARELIYCGTDIQVIITDSPVRMATVYGASRAVTDLHEHTMEINGFKHVQVFVERTGDYNHIGRSQTEAEALEKDQEILGLMDRPDFESITKNTIAQYAQQIKRRYFDV